MLQTVTIDIINDKALNLLENLERRKLIRLHVSKPAGNKNNGRMYKGAMTRQSIDDIDRQLNDLRGEWE